jgi:hypothetical protein
MVYDTSVVNFTKKESNTFGDNGEKVDTTI